MKSFDWYNDEEDEPVEGLFGDRHSSVDKTIYEIEDNMSSSQVEVENKLDTFNYMTVKSLDCDAKLNIYCIGTTADEGVVQIQVIDDDDYDNTPLFYTELSLEDAARVRTFLTDTLPPKPSELLSIIIKSLKFKILKSFN